MIDLLKSLGTYEALIAVPRRSLPVNIWQGLGSDSPTRHGFPALDNPRYRSALKSAYQIASFPPPFEGALHEGYCYPRLLPFFDTSREVGEGVVTFQLFFAFVSRKLGGDMLICNVCLNGATSAPRVEPIGGVTQEVFRQAIVYPPLPQVGWIPSDYVIGQVLDL